MPWVATIVDLVPRAIVLRLWTPFIFFLALLLAACGARNEIAASPLLPTSSSTAAVPPSPTPLADTPTPEAKRDPAEVLANWPASEYLDGRHRDAGLTCELCHRPFPPQGPPAPEACLACHGQSYAGVTRLTQDFTPNPHDWHYGQVSCAFCHKMHDPPVVECGLCHDPEAVSPPPGGSD